MPLREDVLCKSKCVTSFIPDQLPVSDELERSRNEMNHVEGDDGQSDDVDKKNAS